MPTGIEEGMLLAKEVLENEVVKEYTIEEVKNNLEKEFSNPSEDAFNGIDYKPTLEDIESNNNLFKNLKSAESNPETRRAVLNNLENNCKLKGDMGEYFASKVLERNGDFERSVAHEIEGRKNIIDFVCKDVLGKNEKLQALRVSEDGANIITEDIYIRKGKSLAVEIKNGMSEINSSKHLKEQLEAGKDLCDKSLLGINKGMAEQIINNPEKYIKKINDLREKADEIVVLIPDIQTQIAEMGRVDLSGYNIG